VIYKKRTTCRLCQSKKLLPVLDLGSTPLADLFVKSKRVKEPYFPLQVSLCKVCFLVQLTIDVDDNLLFSDNYAFYTSGSPSSLPYFKAFADEVLERFPKQSKKFTLEIASNDGTLLKHFKDAGCTILGIDPAKNVSAYANKMGIETLVDFFNIKSAKAIIKGRGKAGVIIANNVIAHVTSPLEFVSAIKKVLDTDGIFIFECQYFPYLLFNNQFDNVYHEHRSFFSLHPIKKMLSKVSLKIIDIEEHDTQGGSIRVFVTHKESKLKAEKTVSEMFENEIKIGLTNINTYLGFDSRVNYIKIKLRSMLENIKSEGKTIAGYGASAKSNTLLNYCGIDNKYLEYIVDRTPYKYGLYTPGTNIKVIEKPEKDPDYYLLLVWNYASAILKREQPYIKRGGKFIIPIPTPKIV
jgi:SAM-dependent methyltransferase